MNYMNVKVHMCKYNIRNFVEFLQFNQICMTYFPRNKKRPFART